MLATAGRFGQVLFTRVHVLVFQFISHMRMKFVSKLVHDFVNSIQGTLFSCLLRSNWLQ